MTTRVAVTLTPLHHRGCERVANHVPVTEPAYPNRQPFMTFRDPAFGRGDGLRYVSTSWGTVAPPPGERSAEPVEAYTRANSKPLARPAARSTTWTQEGAISPYHPETNDIRNRAFQTSPEIDAMRQ